MSPDNTLIPDRQKGVESGCWVSPPPEEQLISTLGRYRADEVTKQAQVLNMGRLFCSPDPIEAVCKKWVTLKNGIITLEEENTDRNPGIFGTSFRVMGFEPNLFYGRYQRSFPEWPEAVYLGTDHIPVDNHCRIIRPKSAETLAESGYLKISYRPETIAPSLASGALNYQDKQDGWAVELKTVVLNDNGEPIEISSEKGAGNSNLAIIRGVEEFLDFPIAVHVDLLASGYYPTSFVRNGRQIAEWLLQQGIVPIDPGGVVMNKAYFQKLRSQ